MSRGVTATGPPGPPSPPSPQGLPGPPGPPPRREPAERGRLHISSLALRRIVEHVADQSPSTATRRRRGGSQGASARVRSDGEVVEVDLDVALVYPRPIRETAAELRQQVAAEINRLTGRQARTVAVTVVALLPESRPRVE
jgi:uncharacterized alkaline shock family protein YloU